MKRSKRFVFDTNVLISAMLFRKGKPRKALNKAIKKGIVTVSDETIKELDETLQYNRFEIRNVEYIKNKWLYGCYCH